MEERNNQRVSEINGYPNIMSYFEDEKPFHRFAHFFSYSNSLIQVRISRPSPGQGGPPSDPSRIAVNENLQLMAIAFENGTVLLQRGDATKEKGLKNKVCFNNAQIQRYYNFKKNLCAINNCSIKRQLKVDLYLRF